MCAQCISWNRLLATCLLQRQTASASGSLCRWKVWGLPNATPPLGLLSHCSQSSAVPIWSSSFRKQLCSPRTLFQGLAEPRAVAEGKPGLLLGDVCKEPPGSRQEQACSLPSPERRATQHSLHKKPQKQPTCSAIKNRRMGWGSVKLTFDSLVSRTRHYYC